MLEGGGVAIWAPPIESPDLKRFRRLVRLGYFEPPRGDYTLAPYPPSTHAEARRWRQLAIAEPTVKAKRKRK